MRGLARTALSGVLFLLPPAARAQDLGRVESRPLGPRAVFFEIGPVAEGTDAPVRITSIDVRGGSDPRNSDRANHNIDYSAYHVLLGAMAGIHVVPPTVPGFDANFDFILGSVSTSLTESIHSFSVYSPGPGNQERHNTSTDESDVAFGLRMRGRYLLQRSMAESIGIGSHAWVVGRVFAGLEYRILQGSAAFNDERFFDQRIEGDYGFLRQRFTLTAGTKLGPMTPYIGLGFFLYDGTIDVEQADRGRPDRWEADFAPESPFRLLLGTEVAEGRFAGRVDLHLLGEFGLGVSFLYRL